MPPPILLVLLLAAAPTAAPLYKCIGADGVPSFQSLPCEPGQRTAWTRASPAPASAPSPSAPAARTGAPGRAAREVRPATPRQAIVRRPADPVATRCAAARRAADLTRDRLWNRLTFRQRSELDDKVARACAR